MPIPQAIIGGKVHPDVWLASRCLTCNILPLSPCEHPHSTADQPIRLPTGSIPERLAPQKERPYRTDEVFGQHRRILLTMGPYRAIMLTYVSIEFTFVNHGCEYGL